MTLPSTNLGISDMFLEPNPSGSLANLSLTNIAAYSYFDGPSGSNAVAFNGWGQTGGVGASGSNRIYGLTQKSGVNYQMSEFLGLTYYYDNTGFLVKLNTANVIPNGAPFPPPPKDNNLNINAYLYDSTYFYNYMSGGGTAMSGGGGFLSTISQTTQPIIYNGYWVVQISASAQFGGGFVDITINGTSKVTNGTINVGPTPTTFSGATYGSELIAANANLGGNKGLYIDVYCHT